MLSHVEYNADNGAQVTACVCRHGHDFQQFGGTVVIFAVTAIGGGAVAVIVIACLQVFGSLAGDANITYHRLFSAIAPFRIRGSGHREAAFFHIELDTHPLALYQVGGKVGLS